MPLSVIIGNTVDEEVIRDLAVEEQTHRLVRYKFRESLKL
jgi:hypothetical protein